jgi:hypothetical protein
MSGHGCFRILPANVMRWRWDTKLLFGDGLDECSSEGDQKHNHEAAPEGERHQPPRPVDVPGEFQADEHQSKSTQ